MKKIIFFSFLMLINIGNAQSDNLTKVTYKTYYKKMPQVVDEGILFLNDKQSQFVIHRKEREDKVDYFFVTTYFLKYCNSYDYKKQEVQENRTLKDSTVLYSQWKNDLVWEIHDEEQEILGYKVKKATTDSFDVSKDDDLYYGKAIAWFAPDIPIPSGPNRYYGLPGLILKLEFSKTGNMWVAQNIDFNSSYTFKELDKENEVAKNDVVYFFHENPKKIKEIQKQNKKKK